MSITLTLNFTSMQELHAYLNSTTALPANVEVSQAPTSTRNDAKPEPTAASEPRMTSGEDPFAGQPTPAEPKKSRGRPRKEAVSPAPETTPAADDPFAAPEIDTPAPAADDPFAGGPEGASDEPAHTTRLREHIKASIDKFGEKTILAYLRKSVANMATADVDTILNAASKGEARLILERTGGSTEGL